MGGVGVPTPYAVKNPHVTLQLTLPFCGCTFVDSAQHGFYNTVGGRGGGEHVYVDPWVQFKLTLFKGPLSVNTQIQFEGACWV